MKNAYLILIKYWFDPLLTWNPTNYDNLTDITVSAFDVWKPVCEKIAQIVLLITNVNYILINLTKDITMYQSSDKVIINTDYDNVRINYQGNIFWLPNGAFKLYCEINAAYFPFDEQNCSLSFSNIL